MRHLLIEKMTLEKMINISIMCVCSINTYFNIENTPTHKSYHMKNKNPIKIF